MMITKMNDIQIISDVKYADTDYASIDFYLPKSERPCRYEQNQLFIQTLTHFGYPDDKIAFHLIKGYEHCEYVNEIKNGKNPLAEIVKNLITR